MRPYSNRRNRPVVSTVASNEIRSLLKDGPGDMYDIAEKVIKLQLSIWEQEQAQMDYSETLASSSIFGVDFSQVTGVLGVSVDVAVDNVSRVVVAATHDLQAHPRSSIWNWYKLPYTVRCGGLARASSETPSLSFEDSKEEAKDSRGEELLVDADEWFFFGDYRCIEAKAATGYLKTKCVFASRPKLTRIVGRKAWLRSKISPLYFLPL